MDVFFQSMAYPFLACLLLTGIHVYLGIHVIARKVIFVDLALATIAALGAVWGVLLGWDIHHDLWAIKGFSLAFTILGAAVFSLVRMRHERVPQEAIIGITYAVALAAIILGSAKLPHGAEELRELQAGSILWVSGGTILSTALLYGVVALFHFLCRRQFFAISADPVRAEEQGLNVRLWDFLFYVSFGFVVTSSVAIAGVLLVFSYLVIPSVVGVLFAERVGARLAIGWTVGTVVSAAGVTISYYQDLPSGPVIVVCFGIFLALAGILHYVLGHRSRTLALTRVGAGVLLTAGLLQGSLLLRKEHDTDLAHILETGSKSERIRVLVRVAEDPGLWPKVTPAARDLLVDAGIEVRLNLLDLISSTHRIELLPDVEALLTDPDDLLREAALQCVREFARPESAEAMFRAAGLEEDEYIKVELAEGLLELGDVRGVSLLLDVMDLGTRVQVRQDAFEHLQAHVRSSLPYDPDPQFANHAQEMRAFREWWEGRRAQGLDSPR